LHKIAFVLHGKSHIEFCNSLITNQNYGNISLYHLKFILIEVEMCRLRKESCHVCGYEVFVVVQIVNY